MPTPPEEDPPTHHPSTVDLSPVLPGNSQRLHGPRWLAVLNGVSAGRLIELDRPVLLGRSAQSRVLFDDSLVSRQHALIDLVGDRPVLTDLNSKNGLMLNEETLTEPTPLTVGDIIRIGRTSLRVESEARRLLGVAVPAAEPPHSEPRDTDGFPPVGSPGVRVPSDLLQAVMQLSVEISGLPPALDRLSHALHRAAVLFNADFCGVLMRGGVLGGGEEEEHEEDLEEMLRPLATRCIEAREAVRRDGLLDPSTGRGTAALVPVEAGGRAMAALALARRTASPFSRGEVELVRGLARSLAPALQAVAAPAAPSITASQPYMGRYRLVGHSKAMDDVRAQVRRLAHSSSTVLIRGESGTGKEICARMLASESPRMDKPFMALNAACFSPELIESELFGHEPGAFTGATQRQLGRLELASGGTLFLDEVGDLPLDVQAKLLRVLEGKGFYRLGGTSEILCDVRFICATNRNLEEMVSARQFREDFYHRIDIISIEVPPLRTHLEDLPELTEFLLQEIGRDLGRTQAPQLTSRAATALMSYRWPGNVRELRNVLERMTLLCNSPEIDVDLVPSHIRSTEIERDGSGSATLLAARHDIERQQIMRALVAAEGQKFAAAQALGISRPTLDKKIKLYNLDNFTRRRRNP